MSLKKLINLINKNKTPDTALPDPQKRSPERNDIARIYARHFSTDDGKIILDHLQRLTFLRNHAADTPQGTLYYTEGQRALVLQILRLINTGKTQ